jgi:hypothetical protein
MRTAPNGQRQDLGLGLLFAFVGLLVVVFAVASLVGGRNPFLPPPAAIAASLFGLFLFGLGALGLVRAARGRKEE